MTWKHKQINHLQHFLKYRYTIPFHITHRSFEFNSQNTVAVFAQPRGGSTWFTNLINALPHSAKIDGPLYQGAFIPDGTMPSGKVSKLKSLNELDLHFHQYIPHNADWPEAKDFFQQLFSQHFYTPYLFQETSLSELTKARRFVFKFYHASLMMPWIVENFDVKSIFLVRNPYAVIASQLNYYAFEQTILTGQYKIPTFRFSEFFDQYEDILTEIKKPEEILAARWCLNYMPLVSNPDNNRKWLTVSYESMLLHKEQELERVFNFIGQPIPAGIEKIYRIPSISTEKSADEIKDVTKHLNNWKFRLSSEQIENIGKVLRKFQVVGYSEEMEPNYDVIYNGAIPFQLS